MSGFGKIDWEAGTPVQEVQKLIVDLRKSARFPRRDQHWAQVVEDMFKELQAHRAASQFHCVDCIDFTNRVIKENCNG